MKKFKLMILFLVPVLLLFMNSCGEKENALLVQSDSMSRSESREMLPEWENYEIKGFSSGDTIYYKDFHEDDATTENLKVGVVITFYAPALKSLNTHRIVYVHETENGKVDYVITQGDYVAQTSPYLIAGSKRAEGMTESEINKYNYQLEASQSIETVSVSNIRGIVIRVECKSKNK